MLLLPNSTVTRSNEEVENESVGIHVTKKQHISSHLLTNAQQCERDAEYALESIDEEVVPDSDHKMKLQQQDAAHLPTRVNEYQTKNLQAMRRGTASKTTASDRRDAPSQSPRNVPPTMRRESETYQRSFVDRRENESSYLRQMRLQQLAVNVEHLVQSRKSNVAHQTVKRNLCTVFFARLNDTQDCRDQTAQNLSSIGPIKHEQ